MSYCISSISYCKFADKSSTSVDNPNLNADFVSDVNLLQNILKVGLTVNFPLNIITIKITIGKNDEIIEANDAPNIGVLNAIRKSGSKQVMFKISEQT